MAWFDTAPLVALPQAGVAIGRVQAFLLVGETTPVATAPQAPPGSISLRGASFSWAPSDAGDAAPTLADISLTVRPGALVMVVGEVGSGKSSLLAALLGEIRRTAGDLAVNGRIAYTAQVTARAMLIRQCLKQRFRDEQTLTVCRGLPVQRSNAWPRTRAWRRSFVFGFVFGPLDPHGGSWLRCRTPGSRTRPCATTSS